MMDKLPGMQTSTVGEPEPLTLEKIKEAMAAATGIKPSMRPNWRLCGETVDDGLQVGVRRLETYIKGPIMP